MVTRVLVIAFILVTTAVSAQTVTTDTVKHGYYLPLDTNVLSCKVGVTPKGGKLKLTTVSGNQLPDSTISSIGHLPMGSAVVYSEITVLNKGIAEKSPVVRYVIGNKNTCAVKRDLSIPDTLTAREIAAIQLDHHVFSFTVSWIDGGNMYMYDITGNGVFGNARTAIEALPSGTKVYFEKIKRKEDNGTVRIMPTEVHIVR